MVYFLNHLFESREKVLLQTHYKLYFWKLKTAGKQSGNIVPPVKSYTNSNWTFIEVHSGGVLRLRFLTHAAVLVANALVSSRLDYCNTMNRSLSKYNLYKLQCPKLYV